MLQRLDAVRNSARSDHSVTGTVKIIAIALAALTGLTLLFIVSDKAEMPGDFGLPDFPLRAVVEADRLPGIKS